MTCEDCMHKGVCYRANSVKNDHAQKCGDFVDCKELKQDSCEELDFVQPHKKVSVNLEVCKIREATQEEREGVEQYIDSIAELCEDAEMKKIDEWEIKGKNAELWIVKGNLQVRYLGTIHNIPLPPVNPQPKMGRWIPASEKPNDRDWYLGIFKEPDTGWINPLPFICDYVGIETKATTKEYWVLRGFTDCDDPKDYYFNLECVAWMPLPAPFKPQESEETDADSN